MIDSVIIITVNTRETTKNAWRGISFTHYIIKELNINKVCIRVIIWIEKKRSDRHVNELILLIIS